MSWFRYVLLFPLIGGFQFILLFLGGMELPVSFSIFGRHMHELESFTVSGGKTLANFVEVRLMLIVGAAAAALLFLARRRGYLKSTKASNRYVASLYAICILLYLLMPSLSE